MNVADLRRDYALADLDEHTVAKDPFEQFDAWFQQALDAKVPEPNAMTLATVDHDGMPSTRVVLLKGVDARGFVFYTNYDSRKGEALAHEPRCALSFAWIELERQVRIEGAAARVSREESEAYFRTRPRKSQLGALASDQSKPLPNRVALEERFAELESTYEGRDVPMPEAWGGYRVTPLRIELWQGRRSRLHDRVLYTRSAEGEQGWARTRLSP